MSFPKQRTEVPPYYLHQGAKVSRFPVDDAHVSWSVDFPAYAPTKFTGESVVKQQKSPECPSGWADPPTIHEIIHGKKVSVADELRIGQENVDKFGIEVAGKMAAESDTKLRFSHHGRISHFDSEGYPLNCGGRTGIDGRGSLGNWGPNHAADPVVARVTTKKSGERVLQFALIWRKHDQQWAFPGGMVEAGQHITDTRTREFGEEAMALMDASDEAGKKAIEERLARVFGAEPEPEDYLYKGLVDDPRNTDKSWMETVAILTLLEGENARLELKAGDDAAKARWVDYERGLPMFASHAHFMEAAIRRLVAKGVVNADGQVI